ncbi:hypothetical protein [Aerococcus vaginalis]
MTVPEIPSRTDGDQSSASAENGQANDVEILHDIVDNQWIDDIEKADIIEGSREAIEVIKEASSIDTHMPVVIDHEPKELVNSHSDETHNQDIENDKTTESVLSQSYLLQTGVLTAGVGIGLSLVVVGSVFTLRHKRN